MHLLPALNQKLLEAGHVLFLPEPESSQELSWACEGLTWWGVGIASVPLHSEHKLHH